MVWPLGSFSFARLAAAVWNSLFLRLSSADILQTSHKPGLQKLE